MSLNLRRHYPILLAFIFVLAFLLLLVGGQRVIAYSTSETGSAEIPEGVDHSAGVDLFDDGVVHSIQILISEEEYERMLSTYQLTGEKDYFQADVIIDGVRIEDVGLRLKGNASLMTAAGGMGSMGNVPAQGNRPAGPGFGPGNPPEGFDAGAMPVPEGFDPGNLPEGFDPNNLPEGFDPNNLPQMAAPGDMVIGGMAQQSGETKIPLLIKFDEYVAGQTYQGHVKLALRTYGITYDEAMLAEPVTNYAFELMGLPATQVAYAGLQVNDEAETLYVISEVVDDPAFHEAHFLNPDGVLYKAEVGSSLAYVGDDPSSYVNSFSQETRQNDADYAALIEFARFLSESDDATFANELADRLDVESFSTYLAITNLLVNNDSIAGMNNNYYLYYDDTAGRFTLIYWDGNESLGGLGMGTSANSDLYFENVASNRMGMGGSQNILLERFLADDSLRALYEEKLEQVYAAAFASGALEDKVQALSALIHAVNDERSLVTLDAFDQSVAATLSFLETRQEYLLTTELLGP